MRLESRVGDRTATAQRSTAQHSAAQHSTASAARNPHLLVKSLNAASATASALGSVWEVKRGMGQLLLCSELAGGWRGLAGGTPCLRAHRRWETGEDGCVDGDGDA